MGADILDNYERCGNTRESQREFSCFETGTTECESQLMRSTLLSSNTKEAPPSRLMRLFAPAEATAGFDNASMDRSETCAIRELARNNRLELPIALFSRLRALRGVDVTLKAQSVQYFKTSGLECKIAGSAQTVALFQQELSRNEQARASV